MASIHGPTLSIVTPAYNEAANLPLLYARICRAMEPTGLTWEWVVVDDHSMDSTHAVVEAMVREDGRVRGVRFSRNFGSHSAITCGLECARGECVVVMAADLQDPPETLPELIAHWRDGVQVVWAVRARREGERATTVWSSRLYYFVMRRLSGFSEMPRTGSDFFLLDRVVVEAFRQFGESNTSIMALLVWMGFRQAQVTYDKQARVNGSSGWTLKKKLKLMLDSVTSFTYFPIRLMSYVGFCVGLLGFAYAALIIANYVAGSPLLGWSSVMVVALVLGGTQMCMMGILGEYLWRALSESRRRPRYLIERSSEGAASPDPISRRREFNAVRGP